MPLKIRSLAIIVIVITLLPTSVQSQQLGCLDQDKSGFAENAFRAFEKDLFQYYNFDFDRDTIKTYRTFLTEVASLSIDLRKFPSKEAIAIARAFKKRAGIENSIWIKLSDYENYYTNQKSSPDQSAKKTNQEEIYTFNYKGGFIQCLKKSSSSEDFKDIITLLENDSNVSTSLIAQRIFYMTDREITSTEVKYFTAFDVYFSILMVIEKAFPQ